MKRLLVYPFSPTSVSIARHSDLFGEYHICACVALPCFDLGELNGSMLDSGSFFNHVLSFDFNKEVLACTDVLWVESAHYLGPSRNIIEKNIENALNLGKRVICLQPISSITAGRFSAYNKKFHYRGYSDDSAYVNLLRKPSFSNNVRVHFVVPLVDHPLRDEVALKLRSNLINKGKKFAQITRNELGEVLGCYNFPEFMMSQMYTNDQKIIMFYNFLENIAIKDKVEDIIVHSPQPLLPINRENYNDFGSLFFLMSSLVKAHTAFVELDCDYLSSEYVQYIKNILLWKYNLSNIKFVMMNAHIDKLSLKNNPSQVDYDLLDIEIVKNILDASEIDERIYLVNSVNDMRELKI